MFQRHDQFAGQTAATAALSMAQSVPAKGLLRRDNRAADDWARVNWSKPADAPATHWRTRIADIDWVPDLGNDIGSRTWWRGLATLTLMSTALLATAPGIRPLTIVAAPAMDASDYDEARTQMIMPLAFGADSGRRMAPTDAVRPLRSTPERPQVELTATVGQGDSFARLLERAGVGNAEARQITDQVARAVPLSDIAPGTRIDLVLGRRPAPTMARPVDALAMRARFDLRVELERVNGALALRRIPIAVDTTPLRIRGRVGDSLYRSARAAGASPAMVQSWLRVIGGQMSVTRDIAAGDEFDIIVEHRRAETGESETGKLLYAGLVRDGKPRARMVEWTTGGRSQWFEASGVGETRAGLVRPTGGRITSGYGPRRHPILGYSRMHSGIDFAPGYGAPIYAVTDGTVMMAGRNGGYGNFVKLSHGNGLASGYGHMSRFAVSAGQRVRRGQVIGYVGSTGLSTGPHLHYELYRNGRAIDPASVSFVTRAQLAGADLAAFREKLRRLTAVAPGAALAGPVKTFAPPRIAGLPVATLPPAPIARAL